MTPSRDDGWISVADALPAVVLASLGRSTWVLVWPRRPSDPKTFVGYYDAEHGCFLSVDYARRADFGLPPVTHWRAVPDGPAEMGE